jgi:hypothetical protein
MLLRFLMMTRKIPRTRTDDVEADGGLMAYDRRYVNYVMIMKKNILAIVVCLIPTFSHICYVLFRMFPYVRIVSCSRC